MLATASGSFSTHTTVLNPAISKPRSRPIAPENSETTEFPIDFLIGLRFCSFILKGFVVSDFWLHAILKSRRFSVKIIKADFSTAVNRRDPGIGYDNQPD